MPARELPDHPDLEQYRKQAKELLNDYRNGVAAARRRVREHHPRHQDGTAFALADAQLVLAREHGAESWPKFVRQIEAAVGETSDAAVWRETQRAVIAGDIDALARLLRRFAGTVLTRPPAGWPAGQWLPDCRGGDARDIIARAHHFKSWQQYAAFAQALGERGSAVAQFEAAADAVAIGDVERLARMLEADPWLDRARSERPHHATLLHYVGANGVEDFRQRTPHNAVDVATLLLDRGAEVDAVADMYGGATTLALVATSVHPARAGLQEALLTLLIERGARVDHPATASSTGRSLVHACLANGRPEAAAFLGAHGAPIQLEEAAGIGRLDLVTSLVDVPPSQSAGTRVAMKAALVIAATYGHTDVVEFLLDRDVPVDAVVDGFSGLNSAATQGHLDVVRLFLARGASPEIRNPYDGTALGAALWGAANRAAGEYEAVIEALVTAGACVEPALVEAWKQARVQPADLHARILKALQTGARR